jgi:hypothetical protein
MKGRQADAGRLVSAFNGEAAAGRAGKARWRS